MPNYMQYVCKNSKLPIKHNSHGEIISKDPDYCDRIFLDVEPFNGCISVQYWKYCSECVAKGFKNPEKKPLSDERRKIIKQMQEKRKQYAPAGSE